jgi:hypothetical protein
VNEEIQNRKVARRRLLRRAGTVAAGVAGAGVASAVVATPANAAAGDPLVSGQTNSSGTATTTVTNNNAANPTLALGNSAAGGAQLQLQLNPATTYQNVGTTPGALTYTEDGTIYVNRPNGYPDYLRTLVNSTTVESFPPVRVLDTRTGGNRTGAMLNPEVLDADGYIGTGQVLNLNLDPITLWAYTLFCNITVIGGPNIGYMSIFPYGAGVPNTSNVNFGANSVAVNFGVTGIGIAPGANNVISIYAQTKAIVIIDAAALVVNSREDIIAPGANGLRAGGLPERVRPEHLLRRTSA